MSIKNNLKSLSIKLFFGNTYLRNGVTFGKDSFIREHSQIGGESSSLWEPIHEYIHIAAWNVLLVSPGKSFLLN